MAICKVVGYPDLFITFTCNPKWLEVEDFLNNRELNPQDRPDIVCRVFKAKLDTLIKDVRANKVFGRVSAVVYTIEFQKRGRKAHDARSGGVAKKDSPCMENAKCIRHFPKRFVESTTIDDDGYPVYRRREDGKTIKNQSRSDNRYVVPHNRFLLMRYGAINVEWCNQSRSISIVQICNNHDRVTAHFIKSADKENRMTMMKSEYYDVVHFR
ncbi:uncharacterized protein [Arachis hypogaea]|uniref:uncharacterized protein n=1 Tax=Arachis hypogaea TaxID=3818 RepID=UPI003B2187B2